MSPGTSTKEKMPRACAIIGSDLRASGKPVLPGPVGTVEGRVLAYTYSGAIQMSLKVSDITIGDALAALTGREYLIPDFQREFKWNIGQVQDLGWSIVRGRPIGMLSLWEAPAAEDSALTPRTVRLEDNTVTGFTELPTNSDTAASSSFVVLDGQQRLTALAMLFGGLRTSEPRRLTSGRFFLDLTVDPNEGVNPITHKRAKEVDDTNLNTTSGALKHGLMPLEIKPDDSGAWDFSEAWTELEIYLTEEKDKLFEEHPTPDSLSTWRKRIGLAKAGLIRIRLATYSVDSTYSLTDICEIFDTLNTSGTKVSTFDLIHSYLFSETSGTEALEPMALRDWVANDLSTENGTEGWARTNERPELLAQFATSSYIGLQNDELKPQPRALPGRAGGELTSIKVGDLLRLPASYWLKLREEQEAFADTLAAFQEAVTGMRFPLEWCPYPASASIYIGLHWSKTQETVEEDSNWDIPHLNALFRAFFWRNVLARRYDQGFLTTVMADLEALRSLLRLHGTAQADTLDSWANMANEGLATLMSDSTLISHDDLTALVAKGPLTGARKKAVALFLRSKATRDIVSGADLSFPQHEEVEIHHIYPKKWIRDNKSQGLKEAFDQAEANGGNIIDCPANHLPLSAATNQAWKTKSPGAMLEEMEIEFNGPLRQYLLDALIDEELFEMLKKGVATECLRPFQQQRASLIASGMLDWTTVRMGG
jgi:hypothetical protein